MSNIDETLQTILGVSDFAKVLDMTPTNVRRLIKMGVIHCKSKNPYRVEMSEGIKNYIVYLKEMNKEKESVPINDEKARSEKLRADADISIAKARQEELKLAELEGQMHRSEDVQSMTEDLIYAVRGAITAMPGKLAMNVASEDDPNICSQIIQDEVALVLGNLSDYEYSKEKYRKRMRERAGNVDQTEENDA